MTDRDPRRDPRQGDVLRSTTGIVRTVIGRPDGRVRYSLSQAPYLVTRALENWEAITRKHLVLAREGVPCDS